MATKLSQAETVSLEELVISYSYEMVALVTVLERNGILKREEVIEVIKELHSGGTA
jgi:predicted nucleic-acid-binding protein